MPRSRPSAPPAGGVIAFLPLSQWSIHRAICQQVGKYMRCLSRTFPIRSGGTLQRSLRGIVSAVCAFARTVPLHGTVCFVCCRILGRISNSILYLHTDTGIVFIVSCTVCIRHACAISGAIGLRSCSVIQCPSCESGSNNIVYCCPRHYINLILSSIC